MPESVPLTTPHAQRLMGNAYRLHGATSASEARTLAGLDWEAKHMPLYVACDEIVTDLADLDLVVKERAVIRDDNCTMFGVVGREHQILSNEAMFDFADTLLDEAGQSWEAAQPVGGARAKGASPFLCLQLPDRIQVAGQDAVGVGVLLSNGHVGNTAFTVTVDMIRLQCDNQVRAAIRKGKSGLFSRSIQHSGDLDSKIREARLALGMVSAYAKEFGDLATRMANIDMGLAEFDDFLADLLPLNPDAGDRAKKTVTDQRATFRQNWSDTSTIADDLKATRWGALNVVTEIIDHGNLDVRRSAIPADERRFNSVQFGAGARLRERAYHILAGV